MKTPSLIVTLLVAFSTFTTTIPAYAQTAEIDTFLLRQMETFHIPALSVAIIEDGQVAVMKTYGFANLEHQIPNTKETAFQLASATKLIRLPPS